MGTGAKEQGFQNVKSACLQLILAAFLRIQSQRISQMTQYQDEKKEQIYRMIDYIEAHLDQKISWKDLARQSCWSEGYFRSIFKDVTGFASVEWHSLQQPVDAQRSADFRDPRLLALCRWGMQRAAHLTSTSRQKSKRTKCCIRQGDCV